MKYQVSIQNDQNIPELPDRFSIQRIVDETLQNHLEKAALCIRFVNSDESAQLNQQFRNKSGPTNVLAFPLQWPENIPNEENIIGDLVICSDVVSKEAEAQGKSLLQHYMHLIAHGILHLIGYDHQTKQQAEQMESLEIAILERLGYPNPYQEKTHG